MQLSALAERYWIIPRATTRPLEQTAVPKEFADDFNEACAIVDHSPKAAAALARRCLQHVLREKAGTKKKDLADQIQEVLDSNALPTHLAESIDGIRNIGNFAAHPMKNSATGEILPVEPGEAEWCLDTVESLFDFYFVQPAKTAAKRDALNSKIALAGKPAIKGPVPL